MHVKVGLKSPASRFTEEGDRKTPPGRMTEPSLPSLLRTLPCHRKFEPVLHPTELDLGGGFKTKTTNFQVDEHGMPRADSPPASVVLKRPPEVQERINQRVTARHADCGMDFCKKNKITGRYDTYFDVPVSAFLLTMEKDAYDRLIQSTEPVMRAFRHIAQVVYSKVDPTPEDFGIADIPPGDREIFMRCIADCIYFEPKLVDPDFRTYPFVPIVGFDAAPNDPKTPEPVFHEANAGTPSGLSNNDQLLEHVRREDPEQMATIEDRLFDSDDTFSKLRRTIESCALEWTRNPKGISVVIGPGPANGAHPDVASIAAYSGMPMVYPHDLYQDRDGNIRMLTGDPKVDPIVTGIYGRTEETFFFQDEELGIPIRSPDFARNEQIAKVLGERLGHPLELETNIAYQFLYRNPEEIKDWSDPGEIKDVAVDKKGRPKLMSTWSQLARDPTRPEVPPGKLAHAVRQRKLYFSGFGGRIVDHKALFAIVSKYLAPKFADPDSQIARPPRTLGPEEDAEYYANPRAFVTKPPDASGGEGVHIGPVLSDEELAKSVERTRKDRARIVVQDFWTTALTTDIKTDPQTGAKYYGTTIPDIRIFSLLMADGTAVAGEQSFLVRTDVQDIGKTNTGSGGGYGVLAILGEKGRRKRIGQPLTPERPKVPHVAKKHMEELLAFLIELNAITAATDPRSSIGIMSSGRAKNLGEQYLRPVMDLLGEEVMPLLRLTRRFDAGQISKTELFRELLKLRTVLLAKEDYPNDEVRRQVRQQLALHVPLAQGAEEKSTPVTVDHRLEVKRLPQPLPDRFQVSDDLLLLSTASLKSDDPKLSSLIDLVRSEGGEVEVYRAQQRSSGAWAGQGLPPIFYLAEGGVPHLAVAAESLDVRADLLSLGVRFDRWQKTRNELIEDGNLPMRAAEIAFDFHDRDPATARTDAELEQRARLAASGEKPRTAQERIALASEAAVRGLRVMLRQPSIDRKAVLAELSALIDGARRERDREAEIPRKIESALARKRSPSEGEQEKLLRARCALASSRDRLIFDDLFPSLVQRGFEKDGTFDQLCDLFGELETVPRFQPKSRWSDGFALLWQQQQQQQEDVR